MFSKVYSAALSGIQGTIIQVEADVSEGLPCMDMVGALGGEVKEAKERVRTGLRNCGLRLPPKRITVNLSPADIRKAGTAFDLPIATAIMSSLGYVAAETFTNTLIIGEVSLDGSIRPVNGILCMVDCARKNGFTRCLVPVDNAREGSVITGIEVVGVSDLRHAMKVLNTPDIAQPESPDFDEELLEKHNFYEVDFQDIQGQESLKRAATVAAAGMHNILIAGPPGSGKTMIAKRIPTILPPLSISECIEISKLYSICGLLGKEPLIWQRPFRAPHHTATAPALIGGGKNPRPGEISLSTLGTLYLDELPEFKKETLETLRQPLEEGEVTITRLHSSITFPARFMLAASMNCCPCGMYPDRNRCRCTEWERQRYINHISRPLLDRIDICIEAKKISFEDLDSRALQKGEPSADIRERVKHAHMIQMERYHNTNIRFNSGIPSKAIETYCNLGAEERHLMERVFHKMDLSARAYHRLLKVARTIADLEGSKLIKVHHLSEAICYQNHLLL